MTVWSLIGYFNIFVGVMLAVSILMMIGGLILWYTRLGTYPSYRDETIGMMQWPIAILFVLIILLVIEKFALAHTSTVMFLVGLAIVVFVVGFAGEHIFGGEEKKKEEERH